MSMNPANPQPPQRPLTAQYEESQNHNNANGPNGPNASQARSEANLGEQNGESAPYPQNPRDNLTLLRGGRGANAGKWMIYAAGALMIAAMFALLLSLPTEDARGERGGGSGSLRDREMRSRRRSWSDWSDDLIASPRERRYRDEEREYDDDDDDDNDRPRRRSRGGRSPSPAPSAGASFVPPIIINTPGQPPAIFGGGGSGSAQNGG